MAASDETRYSKRIAIVTLYILASEHLKFIETWAFLSGLFAMSSKDTRKVVMSTMQLDLVALLPSTPTRKKNYWKPVKVSKLRHYIHLLILQMFIAVLIQLTKSSEKLD